MRMNKPKQPFHSSQETRQRVVNLWASPSTAVWSSESQATSTVEGSGPVEISASYVTPMAPNPRSLQSYAVAVKPQTRLPFWGWKIHQTLMLSQEFSLKKMMIFQPAVLPKCATVGMFTHLGWLELWFSSRRNLCQNPPKLQISNWVDGKP